MSDVKLTESTPILKDSDYIARYAVNTPTESPDAKDRVGLVLDGQFVSVKPYIKLGNKWYEIFPYIYDNSKWIEVNYKENAYRESIESSKPEIAASFLNVEYTGNRITPTINNLDSTVMTVTGDTFATNAGTYTITISPKAGYKWWDNTITPVKLEWIIDKISVAKPALISEREFILDSTTKTVTFTEYNTSKITRTGTLSASAAGDYTVTFSLISQNYKWEDGSTDPLVFTWSIRCPMNTVSTIDYGNNLPTANIIDGRLFFKLKDSTNNNNAASMTTCSSVTDINYGNELPTDNLEDGRVFYKFKEPVDDFAQTDSDTTNIDMLYPVDYGTTLPSTELTKGRVFYKIDE